MQSSLIPCYYYILANYTFFSKTTLFFDQLTKKTPFSHKALLHFILMSTTTDQRHQSAFIFLRRRPEIRRSQSWSGHLWSPGYYMSTSGNMSKETWKKWNEKSSLQSLTGPIQRLVKNSASNLKPGWFAISCKSHPGFCVYMTSFCYGGNNPNEAVGKSLVRWFSGRCIWQNHCRLRTHRWKLALCP